MHEQDRWKLLKAGFVLYRCSENEKVIKKRTEKDASWKIVKRCETKKEVKQFSRSLILNPKAIED